MAYTVKVQMHAMCRCARARTHAHAHARTHTQDFDKATDAIVMKSKVDIAARRYLGLKLGIPDLLHSDFLDVSTRVPYGVRYHLRSQARSLELVCSPASTPEHSRSTPCD